MTDIDALPAPTSRPAALADLAATTESLLQQIRQLRAEDTTLQTSHGSEADALRRLLTGAGSDLDEALIGVPIPGGRLVCVRLSARADAVVALHCLRGDRASLACMVDAKAVAVLVRNSPRRAGDDRGLAAAHRVASAARRNDPGSAVGISGALVSALQLPAAFADASDATALSDLQRSIIEADEHWAELTLQRLSRHLPSSLAAAAPFARLAAYDRVQGTSFVATVRSWLRFDGNIQATALELCIHPNTLRYRVRRVTELTGLNLGLPNHRVVAHLALLAL